MAQSITRATKAQLVELLTVQDTLVQAREQQARQEAERSRTVLIAVLTVTALWLAF
jgi:hypothetical protein